MTPDLATAGRALFGPAWHTALAQALSIGRATLYRWLDKPPPAEHPAWATLSELIRERRDALAKLEE